MTGHALVIARVSTVMQREEDQLPELLDYTKRKGYTPHHIEHIHGRSAFHGRHMRQILAAVEEHVKNGPCTIVIFRHVDRMSRLHWEDGMRFFLQIRDAGAQVEFAKQEFLNHNMELLGIFLKLAYEESLIKQSRKLQGNAVSQAKGETTGRPPWGYKHALVEGKRVLVPTDVGRTWIPRMFTECVNGTSLRGLQALLTEARVPSPQKGGAWGMPTIERILRNPAYHGHRTGKGNMRYEALITSNEYQRAQLAIASRVRQGRAPSQRPRPLVKPYCGACYGIKRDGCPSGVSLMYLKPNGQYAYYVCQGNGPLHKSCGGPFIPAAELDEIINEAMSVDMEPHSEMVYVPGDDTAEQIRELTEQQVMLLRAGDRQGARELDAEIDALETLQPKPARYERQYTGQTNGQYWESLKTDDARREELLLWEVIAHKQGKHVFASIVHRAFLQ